MEHTHTYITFVDPYTYTFLFMLCLTSCRLQRIIIPQWCTRLHTKTVTPGWSVVPVVYIQLSCLAVLPVEHALATVTFSCSTLACNCYDRPPAEYLLTTLPGCITCRIHTHAHYTCVCYLWTTCMQLSCLNDIVLPVKQLSRSGICSDGICLVT